MSYMAFLREHCLRIPTNHALERVMRQVGPRSKCSW
jgi:hypothetical protein